MQKPVEITGLVPVPVPWLRDTNYPAEKTAIWL